MSTLPDLVTELETDLDAIAGGTRSRMSQDYGNELTEFTALGQTKYQIQASYLNRDAEDSATTRDYVEVEVLVHHALATIAGEQAYRAGQMATDQIAMLADDFWEGMASVYGLLPDFPAVNASPTRVGKRITYSVGVRLALA